MIEGLVGWLVGPPLRILLIAAAHAGLWAVARASRLRGAPRTNALWIPALAWLAYAGWEWLVVVRSPDANIRVDLLLIWPAVALATLWGWIRTAMAWRESAKVPRR